MRTKPTEHSVRDLTVASTLFAASESLSIHADWLEDVGNRTDLHAIGYVEGFRQSARMVDAYGQEIIKSRIRHLDVTELTSEHM